MKSEAPLPFAGSIVVSKAPSQLTTAVTLTATVLNKSQTSWVSRGSNPVHAAYHWLDEDWNMVVFEGLRTPLPDGGLPPQSRTQVSLRIEPPPRPGRYILQPTLVQEGVAWFESQASFIAPTLAIEVVEAGRHHLAEDLSGFDVDLRRRIAMTISCRDCDNIPKHKDAGEILDWEGRKVQVMHDGTKVVAGGYYGRWMQEIISRLGGHHEPQEELIFHHLLAHLQPGALMVEAGSFWAFYSNWFLGAVPDSRAICIEPDENNLAVGRTNMDLNGRVAQFHLGYIGAQSCGQHAVRCESDQQEAALACFDWQGVAALAENSFLDVLHLDTQGAELPFLESLPASGCESLARFVVVSTHHASISGSASTHRDCLLALIRRGAVILCEHSVEESFSGDGLIVASFRRDDAKLLLPSLSKNTPENSLFGPDPRPEGIAESESLPTGAIVNRARSHDQRPPVIICPYLHDGDDDRVRKAFGLDTEHGKKLEVFFWKDADHIGPEQAYEHCWKAFPERDVLILHTDMEPLPHDTTNLWYDRLLEYAALLPQAGIVGCDLLFPHRLSPGEFAVQCAGGLFEDSLISHIGGRGVPYSYDLRRPREVAWATFGGVLIRRSTIEACGQLDAGYQWAYVGDVDYCLEARQRGIQIWQVPVNLLHYESRSTNLLLHLPDYQSKAISNYEYFYDKWKDRAPWPSTKSHRGIPGEIASESGNFRQEERSLGNPP